MAILEALGGASALGSAVYGAIASAKENKAARDMIQQQRNENRQWYNTRMSQDYTMRADAQQAINKQRELLKEGIKTARATNVVAGGTDASVAMQKQQATDAVAQTMGDIAANAAQQKDAVEQQYRQTDAALNQQQAQTHMNQAQQIAQAAGQSVGAGVGLIGVGAQNKANKEVEKLEK